MRHKTCKPLPLFALLGLLLALTACAQSPSAPREPRPAAAETGQAILAPEQLPEHTAELPEPPAAPAIDESGLTPLQRRMARERRRFPPGAVPGARHEQFVEGLPTVWLIGDSTVKEGRDNGLNGGRWGWGHEIGRYFDLGKINVENQALGGTSSRSFITLGYWPEVLGLIQPGDYLIIQFGHNDGGIDSNTARIRARGTLPGNGEETVVHEGRDGEPDETVHTHGWYIRKYIQDARAAGATPIVCSLIPRNDWRDSRVVRGQDDTYVAWARQAAGQENAYFINLNHIIAGNMDQMTEEFSLGALFRPDDHTHTITLGAQFNALCVVQGLKALDSLTLNDYLNPAASAIEPAAADLVSAGK